MKSTSCKFVFFILLTLQMTLALPAFAGDYYVSDVSLTPGSDETQLNITWHTDTAVEGDLSEVKIGKKGFLWFPSISSIYSGTTTYAGVDEYGEDDYYCKAVVTGLELDTDYVYRLGDGSGNWSDTYQYTTRETDAFSFFVLTDPQIGASAPRTLSRSRDIQPYIAQYKTNLALGSLYSEEDIVTITDAYLDDELDTLTDTYPLIDLEALGASIDELYDAFYDEYVAEGDLTDLGDLTALDPTLADEVLGLFANNRGLRMDAVDNDAFGWSETVGIMTEQFPESAFILSMGDQVEEADWEYEYTSFFWPEELTALPLAPSVGNHDPAANFGTHFNLPNESDYGANEAAGDYYFRYGNALIMVLNMNTTDDEYPSSRGPRPPGPPPSGPPAPPRDSDNDGVYDDEDICPDTPEGTGVDDSGCPLPADGDFDGDGVINSEDLCNNTPEGCIVNGYGCPYDDVDSDGIPDDMDRCNNTYGDLTVDSDGCADCEYLETADELTAMIEGLENSCETDRRTGEEVCRDKLEDYKASIEEHRIFMEEAIAANPDMKWKIVMWHYSCYSAARHSNDDSMEVLRYKITPILDELDVDVVLMGHDHAYTRTYQMLGNEPQTEQIVTADGLVVNPTGTLYLTSSSSSGSKYYSLNCNIGDDTSSSDAYYDYAAVWYGDIRTFSHFTVDDTTLKIASYTYTRGDTVASYDTLLIDEYGILSDENYQEEVPEDTTGDTDPSTEVTTQSNNSDSGLCFISSIDQTTFQNGVFFCLVLLAIAGGIMLSLRRRSDR